ncbi:DUF523 domain-containing protein [Mogibacterium pumilum]|uniref:Uncharacterized protein n=1 Tax=Mogibacterium pumilum TaxID=86332 RepID=A0A223ASE8_9FIRM|nr:DUF523 domain-containing protein [Mogibacterium pumilum]ASS37874.1 hypothetical protein AXF17_05050 [Mogibacterium pumilum]
MFVVSSCLLGNNCKYNGGNNYSEEVAEFCRNHAVILVCPETLGGLKTPRPPAEHQQIEMPGGNVEIHVIDKTGDDLTENFIKGAMTSLEEALRRRDELGEEIEGAILKANSPSCGSEQIYDGTFTGTLISGDGIFAKILKERGIPVMSEKNFKDKI